MARLNKVRERYIYLSPTVQAGWEDESNMSDFQISKLLGKGAFGEVVQVTHRQTKLTYAIKQINKLNLQQNNMIEQITNEVKIMYSLTHPNILKLYNHFEDDVNIYLVLEFAPGGQLYSLLWKQPGKRFDEQRAALWTLQLASALEYIHAKNIIHRDIKPENLLIDQGNNLKLADFGWSNFLKREIGQVRSTFCGTLDYLAPEMLTKDHQHDFSVDVWSLGVLTYELLTGAAPFSPQENQNNQDYVDVQTRENIKNLSIRFPSDFPSLAKDFILKILIKDPTKRASLANIKSHLWITSNVGMVVPATTYEKIDQKIQKSVFTDIGKDKIAFSDDDILNITHKHSIINKAFDPSDPLLTGNQGQNDLSNASMLSNISTSSGGSYLDKVNSEQVARLKYLEVRNGELEAENKKLQNEIESLQQQSLYSTDSHSSYSSTSSIDQEIQIKKLEETNDQMRKEYDIIWTQLLDTEEKLKAATGENQSAPAPTSNMKDYLENLKAKHTK